MKKNYIKLALSLFITTAMCASLTGCPGGTPTATKSVTPGTTTGTTTAAQGQGTIKGVVYKSGIKTSGFSIFADEDKGGPAAGAKVVVKGSLDLKETVTKDDGSFEITVKAGAEYSVEAAFADEKGSLVKRTTTVKVPAAKDPQIIDIGSLVTRRTGSIQGVVELEDGKDAEGVDIFIAGTSSVGKAHSKGRFALTGVDAGSWKIVMQKAGYETAYQEAEVKSGRPTLVNPKTVLKKANPKAGIKGKITNNQGQPIPGVLVTAFLQDKDIVAKDRPDALDNYITTTDVDGNYELLNLPTLKENGKGIKYSIQYYRAFYEYVSPVNLELLNTDMPKKIDDITMTSNIAYFGQIKGKVVDEAGNPIDAAVVQTDPQVTDQKFTDSKGNFTLDRVVAGEYQLSIAAGGYCEVVMPIAMFNEKNKSIELENPVVLKVYKDSASENEKCISVSEPVPTPVPTTAPTTVVPTSVPTPTPVATPTAIKTPPPVDVEKAGFLGWYIYDNMTMYDTTTNKAFVVDHHGDLDLYYYEPSGGHGMMDPGMDSPTSFKTIESYILTHVDKLKTENTFTYNTTSTVPWYKQATYTYALAYLYIPKDDKAKYTLDVGSVDDGISLLVNANKVGYLKLSESGSFDINKDINGKEGILQPGRNTIMIILVDDASVDKYIRDVRIMKDGVEVEHLDPKKFGPDIVG